MTPRVGITIFALAGLALRLLICFVFLPSWEARSNAPQFPDAYPQLAQSLIDHGRLGYGAPGAEVTTARGPGFPVWVALGILVGGDDARWLGLWSGLPALILATILAALAWKRYGPLPATACYAVLACHPLPGLIISRVMSDEFYAACGFGAALLWLRVLSRPDDSRTLPLTLGAGALLALQLLTRTTGVLTLGVLIVFALAIAPRRYSLSVLLAGVALVPALAWSVRSSRLEGRPVFVHSLAGYNFWIGEAFDRFGSGWTNQDTWGPSLELIAREGGIAPEEVPRFHYARLEPRELAELDGRLVRAARSRIVEDPLGYLARVARGIPRFWIDAQSRARTLQYTAAVLPVLLLAAVGVHGSRRLGRRPDALVPISILLIVTHNLVYAAVLPMARMSVQVYPALGWLCAVGVAWTLSTMGGRRREEARGSK